jgi:predicted MFS family arabinose efflux permease
MPLGLSFRNLTRVLSHREFAAFTAGNFVSLIGTWMQRIAVGWLTWQLTQSATWLGIIAFADLAPAVLVAPFGGVVADRWDRLKLMKFAQVTGLFFATLLAVLYGMGELTIWPLFVIVFLLGMTDAFAQPARLAFVSTMVPNHELATAVAIKSITFNAARFIGPAVAGIIIATVGIFWAFVGNAVTFVFFLVALGFIRSGGGGPRRTGRVTILRDTMEGVAYAFSGRGVGALLVLMIFSSFTIRPVIELLPGWAADVFGGGAAELAMLTSAIGVGAVIGGFWLASRTSTRGLFRATLVCSGGQAVMMFLFALSSNIRIALPIAAAGGLFLVTSAIGAQTLVQINVEDGMRGRVLGLYGLILRAFPALGALVMGLASETFGLRLPLIAGTVLLAAFTIVLVLRYGELRAKLEDNPL